MIDLDGMLTGDLSKCLEILLWKSLINYLRKSYPRRKKKERLNKILSLMLLILKK